MSKTCPPGAPSIKWYVTALDQLWEIKPEDIKEQWMGVMTKRLLTELNRQIAAVEATREDKETNQPSPDERAHNARILASLEQTLERLARLEKQRESMFDSMKGRTYVSAKREIERKFRVATSGRKTAKVHKKAQRG